jgi:guanylate kinase
VEWARVHGHYYGTSAEFIDRETGCGHNVLLDIDVQGARQLLDRYPDSITIFILPPSLKVLRQRLEARSTDDPQTVERRLKAAKMEMDHSGRYRHVIVNDSLEAATDALNHIIGRYRQSPQPHSQ